MRRNKQSKTEYIGYEYYCVYCGEQAKKDETYEEYDKFVTYYCDCEGAKIEMEAKEDYDKKMSTIKYKKNISNLFIKLRYNEELKQLRVKYQFDLDVIDGKEEDT